jgi:hypothetical protein
MVQAQLRCASAGGPCGGRQNETLTWMVRAVLPTPPSPRTTSLYSVIFPAMLPVVWSQDQGSEIGEDYSALNLAEGQVCEGGKSFGRVQRGSRSRPGMMSCRHQAPSMRERSRRAVDLRLQLTRPPRMRRGDRGIAVGRSREWP